MNRDLRRRHINLGGKFHVQRAVFHIADNTNDGSHEWFLIADSPARLDMFPYYVLPRKELLHELFVYDYNRRGFKLVGLFKPSSLPDWDAHGFEIIRSHDSHRAVRLLPFGHWSFFDVERTDIIASTK